MPQFYILQYFDCSRILEGDSVESAAFYIDKRISAFFWDMVCPKAKQMEDSKSALQKLTGITCRMPAFFRKFCRDIFNVALFQVFRMQCVTRTKYKQIRSRHDMCFRLIGHTTMLSCRVMKLKN